MSGELFARFLGVLAIDLILSGDNAVVIALAVRQLEGKTRRRAIFWGATGAVALRLFFAAIVTYLLKIPFIQAVAALLLVWIAWKLLYDIPGGDDEEGEEGEEGEVEAGGSVWEAIRIIIVADAVMSLDNVVALVGISGGNLWLLVFGLALTIPLIIWGSTILSSLMDRFPWLVYIGSGILIYVAVEMFFKDRIIEDYVSETIHGIEWMIGLALTALFIAFAVFWTRRSAS
ncbi:MAG TPA: TerC family protein [Rubrobacteraceae bacterium]|nr:TerC family protein [Rubrobacteraceae bacterium]